MCEVTLIWHHSRGEKVSPGDIIWFEKRPGSYVECEVVQDNFKQVFPDYTGLESYHNSTVTVIVDGKERDIAYGCLYWSI